MTPAKGIVIGLVLLGLFFPQEDSPWDAEKQKTAIEKWEKAWKDARGLIWEEDEGKKTKGLDMYIDLRCEIVLNEGKITDEDLQRRVGVLKKGMAEPYRAIKWVLLERLAKGGQVILTNMDKEYRKRDYAEVLRIHDEALVGHTRKMVIVEKDFKEVANDLLAKGKLMRTDAAIGLEFEGLGLEVVSIDIPEDESEPRSVIILNRKDASPEGKRYVKGDMVLEEPSVKIGRILPDRVECIFKGNHSIDLHPPEGR